MITQVIKNDKEKVSVTPVRWSSSQNGDQTSALASHLSLNVVRSSLDILHQVQEMQNGGVEKTLEQNKSSIDIFVKESKLEAEKKFSSLSQDA